MRRHLFWGLALAEDDFRESLPDRPVVVDAGESKVLERVSRQVARMTLGVLGRQPSVADRIEQRAKGGDVLGGLIDGVAGHFAVVRR